MSDPNLSSFIWFVAEIDSPEAFDGEGHDP